MHMLTYLLTEIITILILCSWLCLSQPEEMPCYLYKYGGVKNHKTASPVAYIITCEERDPLTISGNDIWK